MCAKFEGNPMICLHFMAFFCKYAKRRKGAQRRKGELVKPGME